MLSARLLMDDQQTNELWAVLANIEERIAIQEGRLPAEEMSVKQAMRYLCYESDDAFWKAVRRLRIPFSRKSPKRALFLRRDLDAALLRCQVIPGRKRRR